MKGNPIKIERCETYRADIFIGGDRRSATDACREFCMVGLCVSVTESDFAYTGGLEAGVRVGLINYPRFPSSGANILHRAVDLAHHLIERLHQSSCTIVADDQTLWLSRRNTE